jgi:pyruvate kinase
MVKGARPVARRAKIIATIGPASRSSEQLAALLGAGVDAVRLNMSHGTHQEHATVVAEARRIAAEHGRPLAVLLDLQGPKIRIGSLLGGTVMLEAGATFTITTRSIPGDARIVSTTYADLPRDVQSGDRILVDDGLLELRVEAVEGADVICRVVHGGVLREHKGINLPGVAVTSPSLTAKDEDDLAFGLALEVEYVALSFVRQAADVSTLKERIRAAGGSAAVIAKLEKPEALDDLQAILAVADGVMIARGDLGVEMPLEEVPLWQKRIIREANEAGVLVITATQMLESMTANPRPTRAEVSDVANAILDGTDVVMLSGETAAGAFPVEAVQTMSRIVCEAEREAQPVHRPDRPKSHAHALARAAATLATNTSLCAIVVFTQSGFSAHLVAEERPSVPILAFTDDATVYHRLALCWGVTPMQVAFRHSADEQMALLSRALLDSGHARSGDTVAIMGSLPVMQRARTNFLKLQRIEAG